MAEGEEMLLNRYVDYIKELAIKKSPEIFTNGGIEYASELMAVLLNNTENEARLFCQGFKPQLITTQPYWNALNRYLEDKHKSFRVLVESDSYINDTPIKLLKEKKGERNNCDGTIQLRIIDKKEKQKIYDGLNGRKCNFAIFDNNKFRFEYEPDGYRAFGSFNRPEEASTLIKLFDEAFAKSSDLI